MKIRTLTCDITPLNPVIQGGYGTRNHPFESVHDPILAIIFNLEIKHKDYYWISLDVSNGTNPIIEAMIYKIKLLGKDISKEQIILCGSHTHSGPNIYIEKEKDANIQYFDYMTSRLAESVYKIHNYEKIEVTTKYSKVYIDGLYSNRNDKEKECDKFIHTIAFFNKDKMIAQWINLSHHCTILGPKNYRLSADLFGEMRKILTNHYHCPVMLTQGNAADMGNRQYRIGNDFEALSKQAFDICTQIISKENFKEINIDDYDYHKYTLSESYELDINQYQAKISNIQNQLSKVNSLDEEKLLLSSLRGCQRKIDAGNGKHTFDMNVEIINMNELKLVIVPGELGSILGNKIKKSSNISNCIIWGYSNGANLGYLVEKKAYEEDSFESKISAYPAGVGDDYTSFIVSHLND